MQVIDIPRVQLPEYPEPPTTETYLGISHEYIYQMALSIGTDAGFSFTHDNIKISHEGKRCFMVLYFKHPSVEEPFMVAARSCYDKSASVALASGMYVLCCANLCISGGDMTIVRKHTLNALSDLGQLSLSMTKSAMSRFFRMRVFQKDIQNYKLEDDQGKMIIGAALGKGIINHGTFLTAMKHWKEPPYKEFVEEKNLWGVYNALTYGCHKLTLNNQIPTNAAITEYIKQINENIKFIRLFPPKKNHIVF